MFFSAFKIRPKVPARPYPSVKLKRLLYIGKMGVNIIINGGSFEGLWNLLWQTKKFFENAVELGPSG